MGSVISERTFPNSASLGCGIRCSERVVWHTPFSQYTHELLGSLLGGSLSALTSMLMIYSFACRVMLAVDQTFHDHWRIWMTQNLLKLNEGKSDIIYLSSSYNAKSLITPGLQIGEYHSQWFNERFMTYL